MPLPMLNENKAPNPLDKVKHIIAIAAGKGGVGKSTVTSQMALALKKQGHKVGILDTDLYGPSMHKILPEDKFPKQEGNTLYPALSHGIRIITFAFFQKMEEAAVVRAPIANNLITRLLAQVDWGELDYLLIDFPPGTGDIQITLSQKANISGAIMVTTPQELATIDVKKAMNMFDRVSIPILGVIENMSHYLHPETQEEIKLFGEGGGKRLASEKGVPLIAQIPLDPKLGESCDQGLPLMNKSPEAPCCKEFIQAAERLKDLIPSKEPQTPIEHRIKRPHAPS